MRKLLFIFFFLLSAAAFGQSETHNMVTYDTAITYVPAASGAQWQIRITRPVNYFTSGNADTASRRVIVTMQGEGQVGTNTSYLTTYGPHYWLNTPYADDLTWDGGVTIGNGTHYDIYITVMPAAANVRPNYYSNLLHTLINEFHPRGGKIDMMGLSMGNQCNVWALIDSTTLGLNTMMGLVGSIVDQEGENGSSYGGGYTSTFPSDMGTWASNGGKFLGLEGDADDRQVWQNSVAMNTAVAGSAYFSYQNFGGGGHGSSGTGNDGTSIDCWNYWWDVRTIDLTSTNSNITWTYNDVAEPHTLGTYTGPPENILQWVLRTGDTTLVNVSQDTTAHASNIFFAGEYTTGWIDPNGHAWTFTSNSNVAGNSGSISPGATRINVPASMNFFGGGNTLHGLAFINSYGYVYVFGDNDQGQLGLGPSDTASSPITTPTKILVDSSGVDSIKNITLVHGTFMGNVAKAMYFVKAGVTSDTLFETGDTRFGARGDGTLGDTVTAPVKVWVPGYHILQITGMSIGVALLSNGTVWTTGGSNTAGSPPPTYAFLGYAGSGNQYLTWHQVTGFDTAIVQIAGGNQPGTIALSAKGKLWGWGNYSGYLGHVGNTSYGTPTDLTDSITNYIPGGIKSISGNMNCFHAISNYDSLYGWGDNFMGAIGNGVEINMDSAKYTVNPAATLVLPQTRPVLVTHKGNWSAVYSQELWGFTTFAVDATGKIYGWGRNKGEVLGNAVTECTGANGAQASAYPNSWDVPYATPMSPTGLSANIPTVCPGCVNGAVTTYCNLCTTPSLTTTANAGSNQSLPSGTIATSLNGGSSTSTGSINYYLWTQTSGPTTSVIDVPSAVAPNVSGLTSGTYTYQLSVTDNAWNVRTSSVNVTVSSSTQTRFYFDNTGSDAYACKLDSPCASITKANSVIASWVNNAGGDTVSFADGSTFYGELVIGVSGTPGHPYVFNNYNSGGGPIPIITGMTTLSTWTSLGGNKYETYCPQCNLSIPENDVVIDGKKAQIARWPNSGWWQYQTTSVDSGITITQLSSGSPNFVGSQLVMRANNYDIQTNVITYQGNDTVKFAWANNSNIVGTNNYGCFFRNTPVGLDTNNAWYFNKTTDSLVVYLTTTPSGHVIMASTVDTIVNANYKQYLTGDSLELDGGNRFGLLESGYYGGGDNLWENCKFKYHGTDAIFASSNFSTLPTITVTHSNFSDIGNSSLYVQGAGFGTVFAWDSVWRVGNVPGDGLNGVAYGYDALVVSEYGNDILNHNFFLHTGGAAIYWNEGTGSSALGNDSVCYNYSDSALEILEDLGAIYSFIGADTVSHAGQESYVLYNIVLNSRGNAASRAPTSGNLAMGIYGDAGTDHVNYSYNFIYGSGNAGINASEDHECKYTHNTIIKCDSAQFAFYDHSAAQDVTRNDTVQYNILAALQSTQACIRVYSYEDSVQRYGIIDSNYYSGNAGAPLFEVTVNNAASPSFGNYAFWQSYATQDVGSGLFQNVVYWAYDSLPTPITVTIPAGIYKDVFNTTYSGTVTIQPYSSIALLLVSPGCNCLQLNKKVIIQ